MTNASAAGVAGIWHKLRRRKVVLWAVAYCGAAWGLLQGLEFATTTFHWPQPILQLATLALLTGLPITVVLAWYHGDRGEQQFQRTELALIAVLVAAGGILVWRYEPTTDVTVQVYTARPATTSRASTDLRPSIAVLPFENRSRLEGDASFVDGIHDEMLTQLSRVSALRVISRSSVERFRTEKPSIRETAEMLGVGNVVEGAVQKTGDRVRVEVRLIDAHEDAEVWAETFDREVTVANVFAIQSEVASSIARRLQATLTPAERARVYALPTASMEAWEAYQLGRRRMERRTSTSLAEAEQLFQKAIDLDPKFALAYVVMAEAIGLQMNYGGRPRAQALAQGEVLIKQALALEPDLPEAVSLSADLAYWAFDYRRAEMEYRRALTLNPNDAGAHLGYGMVLGDLGRSEEALREVEIALMLDPISPIVIFISAGAQMAAGRWDEALVRLQKAIAIDPEFPRSYEGIDHVYRRRYGRLDLGIPWREKAASLDPGNPYHPSALALAYLQLGDETQAQRWLERALQHEHWGWAWDIGAMFSLHRGDQEAFEQRARKAAAIESFRIRWLVVGDLRRGDYPAARARFVEGVPELFVMKSLPADDAEFFAVMATELAHVLQHTGEEQRARELLDLSEPHFKASSRIHVVAIHALRGDVAQALAALREVDASIWTGELPWQYHRDFDARLESVRDRPEFKAFFAGVETEMAVQRARLAARPKDAPLVIEKVVGVK